VAAVLAGSQGQAVRSARLWGAAEALREAIGAGLVPVERHYYGLHIAAARAQLDRAAWQAAWNEGRTTSPERAIDYALEDQTTQREDTTASPETYPAGLSPREAEVLKLVARGLTNARIAKELFISPNTVNRHLNSIYHKLGVTSRAAATRFATKHGLA
jgi:DNA-binding NarL/FixJ family response regulator